MADQNLEEHLASIYANQSLAIYGEEEDFGNLGANTPVSTISQPSFVLRMLDLLKLEKGQKVFELGAGSGWNAALMGELVGSGGKVLSIEIIPELVAAAQVAIDKLGISNVEIRKGDAGEGDENFAPFDRAVFTAGAYDIPPVFYHQLKNGGLLLLVLKNKGGRDTLVLLEKKEDHFESIFSTTCGFVPMTGKFQVSDMGAKSLEHILLQNEIAVKPVNHLPFWWAGTDEDHFSWQIAGLTSFLSVTEPMFEPIKLDETRATFGLFDKATKSIVVARYNELVSYGSTSARDHFLSLLKNWVDLGVPGLSTLKLRAYLKDRKVSTRTGEWINQRRDSQFVWSLPD